MESLLQWLGPTGQAATACMAIACFASGFWAWHRARISAGVAAAITERKGASVLARMLRAIGHLEKHVSEIRARVDKELTLNGGGSTKDMLWRLHERMNQGDAWHQAFLNQLPYPAWRSAADGAIVYVNPRVEEMTGRTSRDLLGNGWFSTIHPDDVERVRRERASAIDDGRDYRIRMRLVKPCGDGVTIVSESIAVRGPDNTIIGWLGTAEEISDDEPDESDASDEG